MILTIRTDKPEAELGLYGAKGEISYMRWLAGRSLSSDIHKKIKELFSGQKIGYEDLAGIVFYGGPGSFTGLRIGVSVANTLANELDIPIAASAGDDWIERGLKLIGAEPAKRAVLPEYGSPAKTTKPKK